LVTPAVWDCLAQHWVSGRKNRSGVERSRREPNHPED
jgi:hypothetical protein